MVRHAQWQRRVILATAGIVVGISPGCYRLAIAESQPQQVAGMETPQLAPLPDQSSNSSKDADSKLTPPSLTTPLQAKVDWLELEVFGKQDNSNPMPDRVTKLTATVFPGRDPNKRSLDDNANALVNAVEFNKGLTQTIAAPNTYGANPNFSYQNQFSGDAKAQSGNFSQNAPQDFSTQGAYSPQSSDFKSNDQSNSPPMPKQSNGHPYLRGLARAAMTAGQMGLGRLMY